MRTPLLAGGFLVAAVLVCPGALSAATPKEIDAAIKKGADYLKSKYAQGASAIGGGGEVGGYGVGPMCLSGLALLEAGVPANDPAVKNITAAVRESAYTQVSTYQVSLCLMYLDRLGDANDVPLIQALAVRLLVSQTPRGGWSYGTIGSVSQGDVQRLKALKPGPVGKFHPEVEEYAKALVASRAAAGTGGDDNSNTQFAVLALWMARKHGVPVDRALDLIEQRYVGSQMRTGGWPYSGPLPNIPGGGMMANGSPAMFCAGLIGLATGVARREEKHKSEPKEEAPKTEPGKEPKKSDDPFFNPPPKDKDGAPPKKKERPMTATDRAVQGALAGLGFHLAESARNGGGSLVIRGDAQHGHHDLYFLWSVERVGVIYGLDKIGGVDWYEAGAHTLVRTQSQDGSWGGPSNYGAEVNTAFAVLVLCRSNLARDLSGKVQKETSTEMKAGALAGHEPKTTDPAGSKPTAPPLFLPGPTGSQAAVMIGELVRTTDKDWTAALNKLRDSKGPVYTQALMGAVYRLEGDRRKAARDALADRLTRMTAATLRTMAKDEDPELRRAAVLAMAMKDDKEHIPDLVAAIQDEEDMVVRAARAGLKSLTGGEDFGPAANATAGEKVLAAESWKKWMAKQKP